MSLAVTLTGSYPPIRLSPPSLTNDEVVGSIHQCIDDQLRAVNGKDIDWIYVSGQPHSDIVGIFAAGLGLEGLGLPYKVGREIKVKSSITLDELKTTNEYLGGKPLKAHLTDPVLIAESCTIDPNLYNQYKDYSDVAIAIAHAFAEEISFLLEDQSLPITHIQIDAPSLTSGEDFELAKKAFEITLDSVPPNIQTILHICHDTGKIMRSLLEIEKIDILSVEFQHLIDIPWLDSNILSANRKKLALGVMPVNTNEIPSARLIERDLIFAAERFDINNIWGITPNCGLRLTNLGIAQERLMRLADVAETINARFKLS